MYIHLQEKLGQLLLRNTTFVCFIVFSKFCTVKVSVLEIKALLSIFFFLGNIIQLDGSHINICMSFISCSLNKFTFISCLISLQIKDE